MNSKAKINVIGNYSPSGHDASRIVDENGIAPTVKENHGTVTAVAMRGRYNADGQIEQNVEVSDREYANALTTVQKDSMVAEPVINRIDIPQVVTVRKYEVDTSALCLLLRAAKKNVGISNKDISDALNVPITMVEHWFRQDDCFSIPGPEIWMNLKNLLQIETDEFDESIMTFEEKEGVFEKSERHYMSDGIAPTLTRTTAAEKIIEPSLRIRKLTPKECFRLMDFDDADFEKAEAVNSNTQLYKQAGNSIVVSVPYYIIEALFKANIFIEKENEMQLKVKELDFPKLIEFNFDELKQEITEKAELYKNMVYTDDSIKEAKADKAKLNKFITALEDKRKEVKKQCLAPYEAFEKQMKELVAIVNEPVKLIDTQVKAYEDKQKAEKLEQIKEYWDSTEHPEWLQCNQIFDQKWLNVTFSMKKVQEAIDERLSQIALDVKTLEALPEFSFEAVECYADTLDINRAIHEGQRLADIQKRKTEAEAARLKAEQEAEEAVIAGTVTAEINVDGKTVPAEEIAVELPAKQWIGFEALLTVEDAKELRAFFNKKSIEFRMILK